MALSASVGLVASRKWRASSPRRASLGLPVEVLDGLAHGLVQPGAPRPTEVLVEGVLDEGVGEAVAPWSPRDFSDQGGVLGLVEEVDEPRPRPTPVVAASRSRSKSRPITDAVESTLVASSPRRARRDPMTARTLWGRANWPFGVVGRPAPGVVLVDRSRLGQVAQHLGHEERVAVGLPVDLVGQSHPGVVEPVPGGRLHEGDDPGVFESLQMERRDAGLSKQAAQGLGERDAKPRARRRGRCRR
jgi:hypothetical protein